MKRIILALTAFLFLPAVYAADVKISALPAAAALAGTEPIPAVQTGATVQTSPAAINTYVKANLGILPAANGGTNNGFTQFTGPATSTKSFALPNASATILTSNALVTVAQGGTGVGTLTGIAKGSGTSAFSAAASSDVISLWSGSCSSSTVLLGDGTCSAFPGVTPANPTASLGLTAINGSAATFMRSDAAPALNVGIAPTWTGVHTWSLTEPRLKLNQTGAGADLGLWDFDLASGVLTGRTRTDADGAGKNWLSVTRGTTTAISNVSLGNATDNPTLSVLGTGTATFSGVIIDTANGIQLQGASPGYQLVETDQGTDLKRWMTDANGAIWKVRTITDGQATGSDAISIARGATTAVASMSFGNATDNPTFTTLGNGLTTLGGSLTVNGGTVTAGRYIATATSAAGNSFYLPATSTPGISANGVNEAQFSTSAITFGEATNNPTFTFQGTGAVTGNSPNGGSAASFVSSSASPSIGWVETDQGVGLKRWDVLANGGVLTIRTLDDANTSVKAALAITRGTTTAISDVSFGNASDNPTFNFLGTGAMTASGSIKAAANISFIGEGASPSYSWRETDQGADLKRWAVTTDNAIWTLSTLTDVNGAGKNAMTVTRGATTAISNISLGNATDNPTYTFLGTGAATFNGAVSASSGTVSALRVNLPGNTGTAPANAGIYPVGANRLGFASNGAYRGEFDANGNFLFTSAIVSTGGTKFTTSGCSVSATAGGSTAGTFTLGANSCSVIVTMAGATGSTAPTGWTCDAHDRTAPTVLIGGESSSTTTTATITIPAGAGATDVISFSCIGF